MSGNLPEIDLKFSERLLLGKFQFDINSSELFSQDGQPIPLRNQSAQVLTELAKAPGRTVSKDKLVNAVWGETFVTDDSLIQCIKDIRKVLGDIDHKIICTIPRVGYRIDGAVANSPKEFLKPSILIEKIQVSGNSAEANLLAEEFYEQLVLVLSRRITVRIFTRKSALEAADYIVQCSASISESRARLFVSLSEAKHRGNFYSESFEGDEHDTEQFSTKVAREVSSILRYYGARIEGLKYIGVPDDQLDIEQLLLKGRYFYGSITSKDTEIGRAIIQVAVDRAPNNPKALALLAHSVTQMHPLIINDISEEELTWALSLADRAIAIAVGGSSAWAFRTRANLRLWLLGDHQGCQADCLRALQSNPNFHLTHLTLATSDILSGKYAEGEERINSFVRLTTIDWQYPLYLSLIGLARFLNGDEEKALEFAKEAYDRMPTTPWYALVYAATAGSFKSVVETSQFRQMVSELRLPKSHFRKLPFAIEEDIAKLERNLVSAGVSV
jgi:DNA-binding winged helix-turn-helix (wHTH) protein